MYNVLDDFNGIIRQTLNFEIPKPYKTETCRFDLIIFERFSNFHEQIFHEHKQKHGRELHE